ncbi:hypothetical protein [Streptomyces sp. NPDC003032]
MEDLAGILGAATGTADDGAGQLFKLLRDMPAAGLGPVGTAGCQAVLGPQPHWLADRSWFTAPEPPADLFTRDAGAMPSLELRALAVAGGDDTLAAALVHGARRVLDRPASGTYGTVLHTLARAFVTEFRRLRDRIHALARDGRPVPPGPALYSLTDRYVHLAAAGAALVSWEFAASGATFAGQPTWLTLAPHRLGHRLCLPGLPELPAGTVADVLDEAVERRHEGRGYDMRGQELRPARCEGHVPPDLSAAGRP